MHARVGSSISLRVKVKMDQNLNKFLSCTLFSPFGLLSPWEEPFGHWTAAAVSSRAVRKSQDTLLCWSELMCAMRLSARLGNIFWTGLRLRTLPPGPLSTSITVMVVSCMPSTVSANSLHNGCSSDRSALRYLFLYWPFIFEMFSVLVVQLRCSTILAVQLSDIHWSAVQPDNSLFTVLAVRLFDVHFLRRSSF